MEQKVFNLLEEPWILAADTKGDIAPYSLIDIFAKAHNLSALSGELPTQDVAVLRLLLGVLYAVYTRTEEYCNARDADIYDSESVVNIWKALWNKGRFNGDEIKEYLSKYHDRFWLVHPERPFWQIAKMNKGTKNTASKLRGDLSESNNKLRLFQSRSGIAKEILEYPEAARWLIYLNGFDDTSAKPSVRGQNMPSPGAGWLGKLGIIYAAGNNLFETLMLNFALFDYDKNPWSEGFASWELEKSRCAERVEIPLPQSQTELLTLQSRRILLEHSNCAVTGYMLLGGDFFPKENAFTELMTLWRPGGGKTGDEHVPKRHDPSKQFWRNLAPLLAKNEETRLPGVIKWLSELEDADAISSRHVQIRATSVKYGDKDFFVEDSWEDSISLSSELLSELGDIWISRITKDLAITDKMVSFFGFLAADIAVAAGDTDGKSKRDAAREEGYYKLDMPFRNWIAGVDPQTQDMEDTCKMWIHNARDIILDFGQQMVSQSGIIAFAGREVGQEQRKTRYTAPEAHLKFKRNIYSLLRKEGYS